MADKTYQEIIKQAEHYKAVGHIEHYLSSYQAPFDSFPWHLAESCTPGGSHRLEISTSVTFYAIDPETGMKFRWSFEIEPHSANGKGSYEIDTAGCRRVMDAIPPTAQESFRSYLAECAVAVRKKGDEWQEITDRQFADARTLERLAG